MTTAARKIKPADDQPFDFNLDSVKSEVELTPWRIHWGGRRFVFQHLDALDSWGIVAVAGQGETEAMVDIFKLALGEQWEDFRAVPLPVHKLKTLWEEYEKHCGVESGESPGSTAS